MGNGEPQGGQQPVALVLGGEDALHHVAAATRFLPGIPGRPPLHAQKDQQSAERQPRLIQRRKNAERGLGGPEVGRGFLHQHVEAADRIHGKYREQDGSTHRHHELEGIGDDHPPEPGEHAVQGRDAEEQDGGAPRVHVQSDLKDGDHGTGDPAHDDQIDGKSEIESTKAS